MKEEVKRIGDIEVKVTFIEQTEEISEPVKLSPDKEEKLICDIFGKKRKFVNGQWEEVHFTELKVDDNNSVDFRIQIKSDFPPTH